MFFSNTMCLCVCVWVRRACIYACLYKNILHEKKQIITGINNFISYFNKCYNVGTLCVIFLFDLKKNEVCNF